MAWTSEHRKPLTSAQVTHFLRRAAFGATPASSQAYTGRTAAELLNDFTKAGLPMPPTDAAGKTFHDLPFGSPESDNIKQNSIDLQRRMLLKQWWLGLMLDPERGFAEKLVLFWQNHFVVESNTVQDVRYLYHYLHTLRQHAVGNFRSFVVAITRDPSMLMYLNGNENVVGRPNENYARELMELFTLGRGYYTEEDVKEAARVLTGWRSVNFRNTNIASIEAQFRAGQHETGNKSFSEHFQKKVISGQAGSNAGEEELAELVNMILSHPESARFIVRKLYRWYFTAEITPEVELNFIAPLADSFRKDYELLPLIKRMLTSDHFFEESIRATQIRSPLDTIIGSLLSLNVYRPDPTRDRPVYDQLTSTLLRRSRLMEMEVLEQPSVFGWRAYYDVGYYKLWINGTTLGLRGEFTDGLVQSMPGQGIRTDLVDWANFVSNPADPMVLAREVWALLMAVEPTQEQLDDLVDGAFLDGIPRYEWTGMWMAYTAQKNNNEAYNNLRQRLATLLAYLLRLAEYQLG